MSDSTLRSLKRNMLTDIVIRHSDPVIGWVALLPEAGASLRAAADEEARLVDELRALQDRLMNLRSKACEDALANWSAEDIAAARRDVGQ